MPFRLRSLPVFGLAALICCGAPLAALGQNQGTSLQANADPRTLQRFTTVQQPVSAAPVRFILPGGVQPPGATRARSVEREAGLAPIPSDAGVSAAQRDTVRTITRGAPQRFRREILPPEPLLPGSLAPPILVPVHRFPPTLIDYYAPIGFRAGSFTLFPAVELIGGYDSNPQRLNAGGPGSYFTSINPEFLVRSNWARHALLER